MKSEISEKNPRETKLVRIDADDDCRIDKLGDFLEDQTGGDFPRGRVIQRALSSLEAELGLASNPTRRQSDSQAGQDPNLIDTMAETQVLPKEAQ